MGVLVSLLIYSQYKPTINPISGFLEADEIRLGSRVGGRVMEVMVEEGVHVKEGDVLIRLEPFDLLHRLAEAQGMLASRKATLSQFEAGLRKQEKAQARSRVARLDAMLRKLKAGPRTEEIEAAKSRLTLSSASLERARQTHSRTMELASRNSVAVTREEIDLAVEALKIAESTEQVRREELMLLEKGTREEDIQVAESELEEASLALELAEAGYREQEIDQARAMVKSAEAAVEAIQAQLSELEIRAGVDGVVDALKLRPGDIVAPNSPVLTLIDTQRMWIRAYVPENRLNLKNGTRYQVSVDSFPKQKFESELTFVSTLAEFTPRNVQTIEERSKQMFRVKFTMRSGLDQLRPGMAADVWISGSESE